MYHKIIIVGNLGADPQMKFLADSTPVTSMSVAVSDGFGDKKHTLWFRVSAWKKQAESCNQFLAKGSKVLVEGTLRADEDGNPRIWTGKDGQERASYEITAHNVRFLSSSKDEPASKSPANDDDMPF